MDIFEREPELRRIIYLAAQCKDKDAAYRDAKQRAERLVGFGARNSELRTTEAYDAFNVMLVDAIGL